LIIRDETDDIINRFSTNPSTEKSTGTSIPAPSRAIDGISSQIPVPTTERPEEIVRRTADGSNKRVAPFEWHVTANQQLYNKSEQFHIAVFCCRQTVTLRTMTWIMSEAQWLDEIPKAMQISEAVACAVRANAVNYMAKAAGATETPHQAFTEYASALKFLQRDLYDSIKQTSYETLFAVLLLGIFDVDNLQICSSLKLIIRFTMAKTWLLG
jgi:hypothetical protein